MVLPGGFCVGLTQGFAILIAQHFGAKEYGLLKKSVTMSLILAFAIVVVMSVLLQILAEPTLRLLNTDPAVMDEALLYLRISYGGFVMIMAYNLLASVLRSLGDGTTPLVAMGIACVVNIGLDLLFVAVFHLGIGGAAIATVTAQLISSLYCAYRFREAFIAEVHPGGLEARLAFAEKAPFPGQPPGGAEHGNPHRRHGAPVHYQHLWRDLLGWVYRHQQALRRFGTCRNRLWLFYGHLYRPEYGGGKN